MIDESDNISEELLIADIEKLKEKEATLDKEIAQIVAE